MESKIKHLEFIQLSIARMGANSFFVKGWSVTLISALAVLAQKETNHQFWLIALVPALTFWGLDAYFLRQERLFRFLYDDVRLKEEAEIDFSMGTLEWKNEVDGWLRTAFSKTIVAFHLTTLFSVFLVAYFLKRT